MRLLILSDIHSNIAALHAVVNDAGAVDAIAFAGDAVDYGPHPAECIAWLREHATWAVRGNHDHALAYDVDCHCSAPFRAMSEATRAMNKQRVTSADRDYLAKLPLITRFEFGDILFGMTHAASIDPLYRYLPLDLSDAELRVALGELIGSVDIVILGHTHHPFVRSLDGIQIVNPGSVGQPKHGDARAAYALWEEGTLSLHRASYPVEETIRDLQLADLSDQVFADLIVILRRGKSR